MNNVLSQVIDDNSTRVNPNVTEGSAKYILSTAGQYLEDIIKSSIKSLSPSIQLKYRGFRKMSAKEEYKLYYGNSGNKNNYDLARSDIYTLEFEFDYMGTIIKKPLFLPYADDGNILYFSNTMYNIIPVLSDTVITPSRNEVFVRLLKDKLTFKNYSRNFLVNKELKHGSVIWTEIVKTGNMRLQDTIGKPVAPVGLYMVGEYGLERMFSLYFGIKKHEYLITDKDLSKEDYAKYNVYESSRIKPKFLKWNGPYLGHNLKICILKDKPIDQSLENIIFGLIYAFDQLPDRVPDLIEVLNESNVDYEIYYWRLVLGRLIYKGSYSKDKIERDMREHFDTLQGYLDNLIKNKLGETGVTVNNFFDLLNYILLNYNEWLVKSREYTSNIKNRYIDILYYVLYDIIIGFNTVILKLNKRASNNKGQPLDIKEINRALTNDFNAKKIFKLVNSKNQGLAIIVTDNTLDIKYPKITAILEDQFGPLSA